MFRLHTNLKWLNNVIMKLHLVPDSKKKMGKLYHECASEKYTNICNAYTENSYYMS